MDAGVRAISAVVLVFLGFTLVGGPMILADWSRQRRAAVIARQIALTDALDGQLGPVVTPVVTKSIFGPWEVRIAAPLLQPAVQARMLAVIDDLFAGGSQAAPNACRILLTVADDSRRMGAERGAHRPVERWAGTPAAAA